jgi:hypothetical protein
LTDAAATRVDTFSLLARVDLVGVVGAYVSLRKSGSEYEGLCPFHSERTPSFTVNPAKGFVHCFGCGAHHNAIGFVMAITGKNFREACAQLGEEAAIAPAKRGRPEAPRERAGELWLPLRTVPEDAPPLGDVGDRMAVYNPKRGRAWTFTPSRVDAYRNAAGQLLGYVMRVDAGDGRKITPTITWCIGPHGEARWCVRPFPLPRPMFGLDVLAAKPLAPVLIPEGEKCARAGADALPPYAVISWPGGSKGLRYVDFNPLAGRDVVLWPDADEAGRQAMLGYEDYSGRLHDGIAQLAWRAGCASLRFVDPTGQPKGWDLADALMLDGWSPRQLAAWARDRVCDIEIQADPRRRVA